MTISLRMKLFLTTVLLVGLNVACATNPIDQFGKIKEGMDKDQVLEVLGNPQRTEKSAVTEKWAYRLFDKNQNSETLKYVKFMNGKVSSFGEDNEEVQRLNEFKSGEERKAEKKKKAKEVEKVIKEEYKK
jgi:outer membrane protein assembly factor BamE